MAVKLGINGFGRIGRLALRAALQRDDVEVVAVNHKSRRIAVSPNYGKELAHSLKYDSVHGKLNVDTTGSGEHMVLNGREVKVFAEANPEALPWGELGVDIVIESTGKFRERKEAARHLASGARKVIISAPGKDDDVTIVMGVNEEVYDPRAHHVISNASCTTNCLAPVAKVLHRRFGIVKGLMTTVHAYTNGQQLLDMPYKDPRRARAANLSIVPTTTGAAVAVSRVLPELEGRLNGCALRVPVPNVSLVDLVVELSRAATVAEVNGAFIEAAAGPLKGILAYSDLPLVSIDYNGDPHSATVDGPSTMSIQENMVKVLAWYDNEWGYTQRLLDLALYVALKGY
ncbi:type I glyceraldehyde-3-phosphate dehydrogenase [Desulforudis sp. 1088]|uniref:type I glyceraldehyde-3-phosphate dehydrogenase n=1 Tax=unclassified Candidatus Desulforudis TaxID=2635950 RepID=UPI003CE52BC4